MATVRSARYPQSTVLSSVPFQLILYLSAVYFLLYFLATLCMIIYKSQLLSYPDGNLTLDLCLLLLLAALELLRLYWGVRGNLQESERCLGVSLALTACTVLLGVYFLLWQTYVLRADYIISAILLACYLLSFLLGFLTLARFCLPMKKLILSVLLLTSRLDWPLLHLYSHRVKPLLDIP